MMAASEFVMRIIFFTLWAGLLSPESSTVQYSHFNTGSGRKQLHNCLTRSGKSLSGRQMEKKILDSWRKNDMIIRTAKQFAFAILVFIPISANCACMYSESVI